MTVSKGQERGDRAAAAAIRLQAAIGIGHITTAGGRIVIRVSPDEADELAEAVVLGRTAADLGQMPAELMHTAADKAMDLVSDVLINQRPASANADQAVALVLAGVFAEHLIEFYANPAMRLETLRRNIHRQLGAAS
jgi:hypothetical protein